MLNKGLIIATLACLPCVPCFAAPSHAQLTPAQSVHALAGTYSCVDRNNPGRIWRFKSVNTEFGAWLHVHAIYPAQNGVAADNKIVFVGYDASRRQWNIVGINSDGSYYTRSSHSVHFDGSKWMDDVPPDHGQAVVRTFGPARYTFKFMLPGKNGTSIRSFVNCTRT